MCRKKQGTTKCLSVINFDGFRAYRDFCSFLTNINYNFRDKYLCTTRKIRRENTENNGVVKSIPNREY